jgi:hypothetical protein
MFPGSSYTAEHLRVIISVTEIFQPNSAILSKELQNGEWISSSFAFGGH